MSDNIQDNDLEFRLNTIDYTFKNYKPSQEALHYIAFCKEIGDLENYTPKSHLYLVDQIFSKKQRQLVLAHRGFAKCLDINININTPNGHIKLKDIKVGDKVYDKDFNIVDVIAVSDIYTNKKCHNIICDFGLKFKCSNDHNHYVYLLENDMYIKKVLTTKEIIDIYQEKNVYIPLISKPIPYKTININYDSYYYGKYIRNKCSEQFKNKFKQSIIDKYGIDENKLDPNLLYNDKSIRLRFLQGFLSESCYIKDNGYIYVIYEDKILVRYVMQVIRSLGGICSYKPAINLLIIYYIYYIPFKAKVKFELYKKVRANNPYPKVKIKAIDDIDNIPVRCISVDSPSKTYIIKDNVITHNTTLLAENLILYLACFNRLPNYADDITLVMYVSDSIENGVVNLKNNIEYKYSHSAFLKSMIPSTTIKMLHEDTGNNEIGTTQGVKFTQTRLEFVNKNNKSLIVRSFGINSGIRGLKEATKRPQLCHAKGTLIRDNNYIGLVDNYKKQGILYRDKSLAVKVYNIDMVEYVNKDHEYLVSCDFKNIFFTSIYGLNRHKKDNYYIAQQLDYTFNNELEFTLSEILLFILYNTCERTKNLLIIQLYLSSYNDELITKPLIECDVDYSYLGNNIEINISTININPLITWEMISKLSLVYQEKIIEYMHYYKCYLRYNNSSIFYILDFLHRTQTYYNIHSTHINISKNSNFMYYANGYVFKKIEYILDSKTQHTIIPIQTPTNKYETLLGTSHNCIIDDVIKDQVAVSDSQISSMKQVIYSSLTNAMDPKCSKMIWLGTPFNSKDPIYEGASSGGWDSYLFPVCERFPVSKDEFRGSWEDRFTYEYISEIYDNSIKNGMGKSFQQEMMLRIVSEDDRLIKDDQILYFDYSTMVKHNYNVYISTDLAFTNKSHSHLSVITVFGYTYGKNLLIIDGFAGKDDPANVIDRAIKLAIQYKPLGIGIEVTGQQQLVASTFRNRMTELNQFFYIDEIKTTTDKFSRFVSFSPYFQHKKVYINKNINSEYLNEFKDEITKVSVSGFKSKYDDLLDTFSQIELMNKYEPDINYDHKTNNILTNNIDVDIIPSNNIIF